MGSSKIFLVTGYMDFECDGELVAEPAKATECKSGFEATVSS